VGEKHPYTSGSSALIQAVDQFRKSFPVQVNADTLKKLGIAPNNETYLLNILRFVGVLDEKLQRTTKAQSLFNKHDNGEFQKGFGTLVEEAYSDLFALHGKAAWELPADKLISFFRNADQTSAVVGQRQASTFQVLAGLSGHGQVPTPKVVTTSRPTRKKPDPASRKPADAERPQRPVVSLPGQPGGAALGLTVRIEINLPAAADQKVYDHIFKSIRENLIDVS
jgi:hypothetical protein